MDPTVQLIVIEAESAADAASTLTAHDFGGEALAVVAVGPGRGKVRAGDAAAFLRAAEHVAAEVREARGWPAPGTRLAAAEDPAEGAYLEVVADGYGGAILRREDGGDPEAVDVVLEAGYATAAEALAALGRVAGGVAWAERDLPYEGPQCWRCGSFLPGVGADCPDGCGGGDPGPPNDGALEPDMLGPGETPEP